jgi:transposase-like protein
MAAHGVEKTPTEIDKALTVLAYYGGNSVRAAAELGMSSSTLRLWRSSTHRDRYLEIAEREGPRLEQLAAQQARELILRAGDAEHGLLDRLNTALENPETPSKELSDLAGTLQRLTTSKGINGTKLLELTGRPTQIVEHRDPRAEIRAMAREFGITIESTAQDLSDSTLLADNGSANAREAASTEQSQTQPAD